MPKVIESPDPALAPVLDNPQAPELFVDAVIGAYLKNGTVRLTFVSRRSDYSKKPPAFTDVVVCRLTMPLAAATGLREFLDRFAEHLDEQRTGIGEPAMQVLQ